MSWLILFIAGLFEVIWAIGLKYTEGFTRFWPSVITIFGMIMSVVLLAIAMKKLPVGTAYTIWTGIGATGTVILGVILFDESMDLPRLMSIGIIILGIIGLKLASH